MTLSEMKAITKKRSWLYLSTAALTLSLMTLNGTTAQADTNEAPAADNQAQASDASATPAKEVTLTTGSTETSEPVVEETTPAATPEETTGNETATPEETTNTDPVTNDTDETTGNGDQTTGNDVTPGNATDGSDATGGTDTDTTTTGNDDVQTPDPETPDTTTNAETDEDTVTEPTGDEPADPAADNDALTQDDTETTTPAPSFRAAAVPTSAPVLFAADDETIDDWMPNKILQQTVLEHLQALTGVDKTWNTVDDITKEDMALLTTLYNDDTYIDGKTSFSLEGLQYAVNLEKLTLNKGLNAPSTAFYGDVTDLSPIANLTKLKKLDAQFNKISDLTPILGLTNLKELGLAYNHITDFSVLSDLKPNLESFTFTGQFIVLDPIYLDPGDRTFTLENPFRKIDGSTVQLVTNGGLGEPIFSNGPYYRWYFQGANMAIGANGEAIYTNIQDQKPGIEGSFNGTIVIKQDNYYFLTARDANVDFSIVQPYILAEKSASVTVHYQDEDGNPIADDVVLDNGHIGETYTTEQKDLDGYTFKEVQGNPTGEFTDQPQEVTYVYTANVTTGTVTVHYETEDGTVIKDPHELTGDIDDTYTTTPEDIDGYKLVTTPANATGTFTKGNIDVTYVYAPISTGTVTVHYVDTSGNILSPATQSSGEEGTDYTTTPITINGYTVSQTPSNASGKYTAGNIDVTYVYVQTNTGGGSDGGNGGGETPGGGDGGNGGGEVPGGGDNGNNGNNNGGGDVSGGDGDGVDPDTPTPPTTQPDTDLSTGGNAATGTPSTNGQAAKPGRVTSLSTGSAADKATPTTTKAAITPNAATTLPQTNEQHRSTSAIGWLLLGFTSLGALLFRKRKS
ncbi:MucBP domain-containing protein [Levilactobacillus spicheri]|uniref:MucBP domain-containing protein n=1 Tax=Levilactobacillus spicheri TaxID=216463 RepID=UPI0009E647DE|nr:MucBP domain-containing protein [Levilactobacillus spicheri]